MGGNCVLRVDKLENGYEVEICDEAIRLANEKPKTSWQDPWKGYAFTTAEEALAFITTHLEKLKPPPDAATEYSTAFKNATKDK
jgi:hypothetical protein